MFSKQQSILNILQFLKSYFEIYGQNLCIISDALKNHLRAAKGLDQIENLIRLTKHAEIKEMSMYCLGCAIFNNGKILSVFFYR